MLVVLLKELFILPVGVHYPLFVLLSGFLVILHHLAHLHAYGLQFVLLAGQCLLQSCPLDVGIFELPVLAGDDFFSFLPGLLPFLLACAYKSLEFGVHGTLVLIELKLVLEVLLSQF